MTHPATPADIARYFRAIESDCSRKDDIFIEQLVENDPTIVRLRTPSGEIPLRVLLRNSQSCLFTLFSEHGAEHDIFTSCAATDASIVSRLLDQDASLVHATDEAGNTPLHWARTRGFSALPRDEERVVDILLDHGADIEALNAVGNTPLRHGMLYGTGETDVHLVERGAKPDILFYIVVEDIESLGELLSESPEQIHWIGPRGQTVLHVAVCEEVSPEVVEFLLAKGANAQLEARYSRRTPLLMALSVHPEAAEVFIRHGADVNASELPGGSLPTRSALQIAVHDDRPGLVEMLLAHGAHAQVQVRNGQSLLHHARSTEVAKMLIAAWLDVNAQDDFGARPIDCAIEEGRRDVALLLLEHGAPDNFFVCVAVGDRDKVGDLLDNDPSLITAYNNYIHRRPVSETEDDGDWCEVPYGSLCGTALHYAVKAGLLEMVEFLLARGAPVNAATEPAKWTPLHDAAYYAIMNDYRNSKEIIRKLVAAGADFHAKTWGGGQPLDIAAFLDFREASASIFDLLQSLKCTQ